MKTSFFAIAVLAFIALSHPAFAVINGADLNKEVVLTEKASLLTQVDAVSLYMSSNKVSFAPQLLSDNIIEVKVTVLDRAVLAGGNLKKFVERRINTFKTVLGERLPVYAPSIAKSFDAKKDIRFVINSSADQKQIATCTDGNWNWSNEPSPLEPISIATAESLAATVPDMVEPQQKDVEEIAPKKGKLACDCPARKK